MQDKVPLPPHPWRLPMDEKGAWGDKEREVLLAYGSACAAAAREEQAKEMARLQQEAKEPFGPIALRAQLGAQEKEIAELRRQLDAIRCPHPRRARGARAAA